MELSSLPHLIQLLTRIRCIVVYVVKLTSLGYEEPEISFINVETVKDVNYLDI